MYDNFYSLNKNNKSRNEGYIQSQRMFYPFKKYIFFLSLILLLHTLNYVDVTFTILKNDLHQKELSWLLGYSDQSFNSTSCVLLNQFQSSDFVLKPVFRIRILLDPYHWPGSRSASGSVDLDPGTKKKIVINSHTNQPKYKNISFF